jgi:hypothetical protein
MAAKGKEMADKEKAFADKEKAWEKEKKGLEKAHRTEVEAVVQQTQESAEKYWAGQCLEWLDEEGK